MFASVNGVRCQSLRLVRPSRGLWTADVVLANPLSDGGRATLVLAGLEMVGHYYRFGDFLNNGYARIVGGNGGWLTTIEQKFYKSPFGVKLTPVLQDAATAAGETVTVAEDTTIGNFYIREVAPAARVLNQLCPSWYVLPSGATFVGPFENPVIASRFDVLVEGTDMSVGRVAIATDRPEDWIPGALFTAPTITTQRQVSTVVHKLTKDRLRTEVWTSP